jgi:hypothetical protein
MAQSGCRNTAPEDSWIAFISPSRAGTGPLAGLSPSEPVMVGQPRHNGRGAPSNRYYGTKNGRFGGYHASKLGHPVQYLDPAHLLHRNERKHASPEPLTLLTNCLERTGLLLRLDNDDHRTTRQYQNDGDSEVEHRATPLEAGVASRSK